MRYNCGRALQATVRGTCANVTTECNNQADSWRAASSLDIRMPNQSKCTLPANAQADRRKWTVKSDVLGFALIDSAVHRTEKKSAR